VLFVTYHDNALKETRIPLRRHFSTDLKQWFIYQVYSHLRLGSLANPGGHIFLKFNSAGMVEVHDVWSQYAITTIADQAYITNLESIYQMPVLCNSSGASGSYPTASILNHLALLARNLEQPLSHREHVTVGMVVQ
jgi:hypothetical protein